jgi:MoxR-like ATPase
VTKLAEATNCLPHPKHSEPLDGLCAALNHALRGKGAVIEFVLACLLSRGHLLLEDLPGLGKTTLAKALAEALGGTFARVQCTPDLLPGDITGFSIFNQKTREFEFLPGPVFSDVLLADEINRTTPRTQSALLEAMAERQTTVDNIRRTLPSSFFVIATQNPIEHHGTYPLPEAQLDRFAMKLSIGYAERADELDMLAAAVGDCSESVHPPRIMETAELIELQQQVSRIVVSPKVRAYIVDLGRASRSQARISLGLSPRGLLTWQRVAQAWAFLRQRPFVTPDDVQQVALPVLGVRLGISGDSTSDVINQLLESVPVPV